VSLAHKNVALIKAWYRHLYFINLVGHKLSLSMDHFVAFLAKLCVTVQTFVEWFTFLLVTRSLTEWAWQIVRITPSLIPIHEFLFPELVTPFFQQAKRNKIESTQLLFVQHACMVLLLIIRALRTFLTLHLITTRINRNLRQIHSMITSIIHQWYILQSYVFKLCLSLLPSVLSQ